jgi:hypothetical protein
MDKRSLHHLWTVIRPIKVWYLLVPLLVGSAVTITALRDNNLKMVQLRKEVYQADEQNKDVEMALQRLRTHVHSHMNTDLSGGGNAVYPPVQLKYTYQRLRQAEQERVKQASSQVYTDAQSHCEGLHPTGFSGSSRIPCIEQYVSEHKVVENTIPDAMYKFDFVSPTWSPDVAGISFLVSALLFVLAAVRIIAGRLLKTFTK